MCVVLVLRFIVCCFYACILILVVPDMLEMFWLLVALGLWCLVCFWIANDSDVLLDVF